MPLIPFEKFHKRQRLPRIVKYFEIECIETHRRYKKLWYGSLTPICNDCFGGFCKIISVTIRKYAPN